MHYIHLLMHSKVTTRTALNLELVTANGSLEFILVKFWCCIHNLWSYSIKYCQLYPCWIQLYGHWYADHTFAAVQVFQYQ